MTNLCNKIALITGSSRGVGLDITKKFLSLGINCIITGKDKERLFSVEHELNKDERKKRVTAIQCDLRYEDQIDNLYNESIKKHKKIDILVHNAGALNIKNINQISVKEYNIINSINAHAPFLLTKKILPNMSKNKYGRVIFHAPPIGYYDEFYQMMPYLQSKYQMSYMNKFLSKQYNVSRNITFNTIWPHKALATDAVISRNIGDEKSWRSPRIISDSIKHIILEDSNFTGNELIDEEYLLSKGYKNFSSYRMNPDFEPIEMNILFKRYL